MPNTPTDRPVHEHLGSSLLENQFLRRLVTGLPRHPHQLNAPLDSDAELIPLAKDGILACTTDSIVEEIDSGLYRDPFQIGWMCVMANLSDLAAVGARPLGLLLTQHLPEDLSAAFLSELQGGITAACRAAGTYILGGDTNRSATLQVGATAIGLIESGPPLTRRGCRPGDLLYASAPFGLGNGFAFAQLFTDGPVPDYQPHARLREGALARRYASAGIDTSDGFMAAIAQLMDRNGTGFRLDIPLAAVLAAPVRQQADRLGIPDWIFLAGPHGEFELLFTVPPDREAAFLQAAKQADWQPCRLGTTTADPELISPTEQGAIRVDPFHLTNLYLTYPDPQTYLQALLNIRFDETPKINR